MSNVIKQKIFFSHFITKVKKYNYNIVISPYGVFATIKLTNTTTTKFNQTKNIYGVFYVNNVNFVNANCMAPVFTTLKRTTTTYVTNSVKKKNMAPVFSVLNYAKMSTPNL